MAGGEFNLKGVKKWQKKEGTAVMPPVGPGS
jgi:hypothetical protein